MDITLQEFTKRLADRNYIAEQEILLTVFLALSLGKPLLIEGEPGVGKTEIAKVLAQIFDTELIRLQCYEGLDETKALYEWDYQRQLLKIQLTKDTTGSALAEAQLFSAEYLLARPLLRALQSTKPPVLLIDEIDKTDEEFEAFLFEVLSDFQVSIPEMGTVRAQSIPMVVLTSNGERELSDGLKRRCVYLYINYPSLEKEMQIINAKVPQLGPVLAQQLAGVMYHLRQQVQLRKKPSISETLDWARALILMDVERLSPDIVDQTMNVFLKNKEDLDLVRDQIGAQQLIQQGQVHCKG